MLNKKLERIDKLDEEILQMKNRRSLLWQSYKEEEKSNRTNRLCRRGGLLEKMLPDLLRLDHVQFKAFLEETMHTGFAQKKIDAILTADSVISTIKPINTQPTNSKPAETKQTATPQNSSNHTKEKSIPHKNTGYSDYNDYIESLRSD